MENELRHSNNRTNSVTTITIFEPKELFDLEGGTENESLAKRGYSLRYSEVLNSEGKVIGAAEFGLVNTRILEKLISRVFIPSYNFLLHILIEIINDKRGNFHFFSI